MKNHFLSCLVFLSSIFIVNAQRNRVEIHPYIEANALFSTKDSLPFWMFSNTHGAVSPQSNFLTAAKAYVNYSFSENDSITVGAGIFYRDGVKDYLQRDELFIQYTNNWLRAVAGSKNPEDRFNGVSVSNGNFLMSGNARALPGILLESPKYIKLFGPFLIDYGLGHYFMNDDRFVKDTWVHYKRLGGGWKIDEVNTVTLGFEHYAQWAGTSLTFGKQPNSISDFFDVFLTNESKGVGTPSDQNNALGNHLSVYDFRYHYDPYSGSFSFYHQHYIEDGSGRDLKNFPDGLWGISYEPNQRDYDSFLKAILFEYVQTTDQSGSSGSRSRDNYFNNGIYKSGWTYENRTIGVPLLTPSINGLGIDNNRVRGYHFGLATGERNWAFNLKATYVNNFGSYKDPYPITEHAFYSYLNISYRTENIGKFTLLGGFDHSNLKSNTYGGGIQYSYSY